MVRFFDVDELVESEVGTNTGSSKTSCELAPPRVHVEAKGSMRF